MTGLSTEDATVEAVSSHVSTNVDGEEVVLEVDAGKYHGLKGIGPEVWEFIQEPKRVSDVQERIVAEYDIDPQQCREDVVEFLHELQAAGLVRVEEDGEAPPK